MAEGACEAQPYDKLQRNIRIEGETMRKDHVGRITPRLNKFPYRYGRDVNSLGPGGEGGRRERNRIGGRRARERERARKAREKHRTLLAELLSPRSTRATKRKNEIRTVPNGIVRGSTVIDRSSMNGRE